MIYEFMSLIIAFILPLFLIKAIESKKGTYIFLTCLFNLLLIYSVLGAINWYLYQPLYRIAPLS